MNRDLISKAVEEAKGEEANLVIWDRRDTFTIESGDVKDLDLADDYLTVKMEDGKVTVYVEYGSIYKLVVERERKSRSGIRAGFGAAQS
ncbi:MAG TPA: hypothetical protein VFJ72_01635 [Rubrobacteraceae bacterium]|nr:hypothetical protein [Rubrobacteraceae bacterium]